MTIHGQLIRFAEIKYPAKILIGRVTPQGILIRADGIELKNVDEAVDRMNRVLILDAGGLKYKYQLTSLDDMESAVNTMRRELESEALVSGLPTEAWK
jgi:hypothetical protein